MKTKSNHEIFFEFQNEFISLTQFSGVRSAKSILDEIEKIARNYIAKNRSVFIENEATRDAFDRMYRIICFPYSDLYLTDKKLNDSNKYDRGAVRLNLLNSFNQSIVELNVTISDRQRASLDTQLIGLNNRPDKTIQSNLFNENS